jgi:hypothetical protein
MSDLPRITTVESLDDPAVADYRNLKDRELARAAANSSPRAN